MKKIISLVLSLILCSTLLSSTTVSAKVTKGKCGKNVTYKLDTKKLKLTISGKGDMFGYLSYGFGFSRNSDGLCISYRNYEKYLPPWLYIDLDEEYEEVYNDWKSVTVEEGVTSIGSGAFSSTDCWAEKFYLPSTLKVIYGGAFSDCRGLKSITIPDNVRAFSSKVDFYKDNKEYYREGTFYSSDYLINVKISEKSKLKSIGYRTFMGTGIKYFNSKNKLPNVTHVGVEAFRSCWNLKKVSLPKAEVYKSTFEDSRRLNTVDISGTKKVRAYTFRGCWGLENIKFGNKLTWIGTESFKDCKALKKITIPKNVEEIRYNAFMSDTNLKTVIINSKKLKAVRTDAFKNVNKDVVFKVPKSKLEQHKALIAPNAPETARFVGV